MDHRELEPIVEYLKQKNQLSPLESDIIETWETLVSQPFDANAAEQKIVSNNAKYPEIFITIAGMPNTVIKPFSEVTEEDIKYNLRNQLEQMVLKGALSSMNGRR